MKKTILGIVTTIALTTSSLNAASSYATVNGEEITKSDILSLIRNPEVKFETLPKETKDKIISQLIEKKLLTQKAVKSGLEKDEQYIQALDKIKRDLALEIWMQKEFKKVNVTEKDKKDFYKENQDNFKTDATLEARHILLKTEKEANDIISKLNKANNKKGSFEELAKKYSTGPTKDAGGYLGKFQAKQMVPEFSNAAMLLKTGEYTSAPVKTQFGFHVIYLESKENASVLEYDKVKDKITQLVVQERYSKIISSEVAKLKKNAKIIIK